MSIDYVVSTTYRAKDEASGTAKKIGASFDNLDKTIASSMARVGGAIDAIGRMAVGSVVGTAAAGAALAGYVTKTGLNLNAQMEDAQIGFASVFNSLGAVKNFEDGLTASRQLIAGIRKDADALPGEFQDFVSMAKTISPALVMAGGSLEQLRKLTADTAIAGQMHLGGNFEMAGREMAELLQGRAGAHNKLGTGMGINTHTKIDNKGTLFNSATAAERLAYLNKAMSKNAEAMPYLAQSWAGLTTTLTSAGKNLMSKATEPLFNAIKSKLAIYGAIDSNPAFLNAAEAFGTILVKGFDKIVSLVEWIGKHWDEISAKVDSFIEGIKSAFTTLTPIFSAIGGVIGKVIDNPLGAAGGMAAARGATMLPGMASGMGEMLGVGAAEGLAALAAILAPIVGALDILFRNVSDLAPVMGILQEAAQGFTALIGESFKTIWSELVTIFDGFMAAARPVVDLLGVLFLANLTLVAKGLELVLWPLAKLAEGIGWVLAKIGLAGGDTGKMGGNILANLNKVIDKSGSTATGASDPPDKVSLIKRTVAEEKKTHGGGKTSVTVNAPMTILSDSDPERLALKVSHKIRDELLNPKSAIGFSVYRHG